MDEKPSQIERYVPTYNVSFIEDPFDTLMVNIILVWGLLDTISTYIAIAVYDTIEYEANPLTYFLLSHHPILLGVAKALAVIAIGALAIGGKEHLKAVSTWKAWFICILWAGILTILLNLYAATTEAIEYDPVFA